MSKKIHKLKTPSSYIVVVLRSLMHQACVCCNEPIHTYEESIAHWDTELEKTENLKKGEKLFSEVSK